MIRGRQRDLTQVREAKLETSLHNRFEVEVVDGLTGEIKQRAKAENVICEQLWTRLLTPNSYFNYIHYGTGTGTPSSTDTGLFAFAGSLELSGDVCDYSHAGHWYSLRRQGQLAENVAVGQTLTEVGIAYGTGSNTLCTHAMLRDMNGNQISIQKTDTDVINVYATVFVHWPDSLVTGGVQILPYAYTDRGFLAYLAGRYSVGGTYEENAAKPLIFAALACRREFYGEAAENKASSVYEITNTYHVEQRTITSTMKRIPVGGGNWRGGARGIVMFLHMRKPSVSSSTRTPANPALYLEAGKGDWFPGSYVKGEAIGTGDGETVDFVTTFDDPEAATIYVDGMAATDVRVEKLPAVSANMEMFFDIVDVKNGVAYPKTYASPRDLTIIGSSINFNPYWMNGVDNFYVYNVYSVCVSDDLVNWDYIVGSADSTESFYNKAFEVPESLKKRKYWEIRAAGGGGMKNLTSTTLTGKNIHFTTPPPAGSVITADYFTRRIAKDSNHVFDLTLTIQLGERTI